MTGSHRTNPRDDPAPDAATEQAAARLGHALRPRFVVERPLGRGGMGTVFLARDLRHARPVAVKVLHPELATAVGAERFLREIRTAAGLQHPHIVTVFDSGERAGLLYYIMPYVEGESLRARLEREGPLPVPEAVRIARDVAEALAFAHAHGIVHRDVKPENILLPAHGHACVVDFGVARALSAAASRLTATGLILGSPAYMSPEQAAGTRQLDGRSDVYSLGCVLHEMLTGAPPFDGPTLQAILLRQMTEEALDVRALRPEVPAELAAAVRRAMAKEAGERFGGAREFAEALVEGGTSLGVGAGHSAVARLGRHWRPARPARALALVVAAASALGAAAIGLRGGIHGRRPAPTLDPARYVILPFRYDPDVPEGLSEQDRLHDALMRWSGVDVVDPARVVAPPAAPGAAESARVAARLGAGHFVVGRVSRVGDSLRVYVEVGRVGRPDSERARIRVAMAADRSDAGPVFRALGDSIVLRGLGAECVDGGTGTLRLAAVRACSAAFAALGRGDVVRADTLFQQALDADTAYARAALWLAEIRGWLADDAPDRHALVARAEVGAASLRPRERAAVAALAHLDSGEFGRACEIYGGLIARDSLDVAAWLGLAACQAMDHAVLRDARSPSGWRFRSSSQRTVEAYGHALELRPALMASYRADGFAAVRSALYALADQFRAGRALPPDTGIFLAEPSWEGDSLALWPFRLQQVVEGRSGTLSRTLPEAVDHGRELFRRIADRWVAGAPSDPTALEALATARQAVGDPTALDAVRLARAAAVEPSQRLRLAANDVWVRLQFALPDRLADIDGARSLADSLLAANAEVAAGEDARVLRDLAVLTGRAALAASLARRSSDVGGLAVPSGVSAPASALLVYAALGEPADSIRVLEKQTVAAIRNLLSADTRGLARDQLVVRPAVLAFPAYRSDILRDANSGYHAAAESALLRGDTAGAREILARAARLHSNLRPADVSLEGLLIEARLLLALADSAGAGTRLDPTLNAIQFAPPGAFSGTPRAAALVRAMALRAELAAGARDPSAARWARPVAALWSGADPELQTEVARMRRLAGTRTN